MLCAYYVVQTELPFFNTTKISSPLFCPSSLIAASTVIDGAVLNARHFFFRVFFSPFWDCTLLYGGSHENGNPLIHHILLSSSSAAEPKNAALKEFVFFLWRCSTDDLSRSWGKGLLLLHMHYNFSTHPRRSLFHG